MAIKGKGRTRQRQVARAPRREPVTVQPPVMQRRWVQVVAAFLLGVFAMVVFVWVTNGLRRESDDEASAAQAQEQRKATLAYETQVRSVVTKIGQLQEGLPPILFPEMDATLRTMDGGTVPKDALDTFRKTEAGAQEAIDALTTYDLASSISGKGFDVLTATAFTSSKDDLIQALQTYRRAAEVGTQAATLTGDQLRALTKVATDLHDGALEQLQRAWSEYVGALNAGGVPQQPSGPIPGLPGGGG
jgi:hypothetical protein